MNRKPIPLMSTTLPKDAREALVAASQHLDPHERKRAVQAAIERAQRKYPQLFNLNEGAPA